MKAFKQSRDRIRFVFLENGWGSTRNGNAVAMERGGEGESGIYFGEDWTALFSVGGRVQGRREASQVTGVSGWSNRLSGGRCLILTGTQ